MAPGVTGAVVIARPDAQGEQRLLAYITGDVDIGALTQSLEERLPAYMAPAAIIPMRALPLTANGKIDRKALREPDTSPERISPRTEVESKLLDIWRSVLKSEQIGVTDNFFAVGGDSIRSLQVIARARRVGLRLTPAQVLEAGSVERLAILAEPITAVDPASRTPRAEIPRLDKEALAAAGCDPANVQDAYPATAAQAGLLFHTRSSAEGLYVAQLR